MTFRHGLILVAALSAALPAAADDINDQILSSLNSTLASPEASGTGIDAAPSSVIIEADLWQRIRNGFALPPLENELVTRHENWYASRPDYWQRMMERSSKYLHFVVEEVEKRGYPSEIALLPMIESAYNPRAHSHAKAAGMWQFIPSTGTHYGLEQTWWYDGRRDIFAATRAALDYLGMLYGMFGDWQLALAAYNWGEGAVSRAIARNQARGLPTNYESLKMPAETRNYVPKLMAVRNLVGEPERYGVMLPMLENKPYFSVVTTTRHMDLELAARMADMSLDDFLALNPAYNQPVIAYKASRKLLVPQDKAELFTRRLSVVQDGLLSWQAHQAARGETLDDLVSRYGGDAEELQRINRLTSRRLSAGQLVLVPRSNNSQLARAASSADIAAVTRPADSLQEELAQTQSQQTLQQVATSTTEPAPAASAPVELASAATPAAEPAPMVAATSATGASMSDTATTPDTGLAQAALPEAGTQTAGSTVLSDTTGAIPEVDLASVASDDSEPPAAAPQTPTRHVVARGDTAFSLAQRYGLSVQELLEINGLRNSRLQAGQTLRLSASAATPRAQRATARSQRTRQYVVRNGDTAFSIARRFKVEMAELLRWNGLKSSSVLRPGDSMTIYLASN